MQHRALSCFPPRLCGTSNQPQIMAENVWTTAGEWAASQGYGGDAEDGLNVEAMESSLSERGGEGQAFRVFRAGHILFGVLSIEAPTTTCSSASSSTAASVEGQSFTHTLSSCTRVMRHPGRGHPSQNFVTVFSACTLDTRSNCFVHRTANSVIHVNGRGL